MNVRQFAPLFFLFLFLDMLPAQQRDFSERIQIALWAELDAYPGLAEAQDMDAGLFAYPVSRIKQTAPFLLYGMVYGWKFRYMPLDKMRGVEERFEIEEIGPLTAEGEAPEVYRAEVQERIVYEKPWIEGSRLCCWVRFERTPQMVWNYRQWNSIVHERIRGRGQGSVASGFDGITDAASAALKDAVRVHYRSITKNKPKEIAGRVLIRGEPRIGIIAGRYTAELDFFLETDRIIQYTQF